VTTSVVEQQVEELPPTPAEAPTAQAPPTTAEAPPAQRRLPPITTTFVIPEPETGSGGEGS